jgi:hypothetical protein
LDGLEILSAIKHSDLASDLKVDTKNLYGEELRKAHEKELKYYTKIIDDILSEDDLNRGNF